MKTITYRYLFFKSGIIKNANKTFKEKKNMSLKLEAKKSKLETQLAQTLEKVADLKNQIKSVKEGIKLSKKKK